MNDIDICRALITAVSAVHHDTVLSDTKRIAAEDILLQLRRLIVDEDILRKAEIFDRLKNMALTSLDKDRTIIEFDKSSLINLFGSSISLIMGKEFTGSLSVGFKEEHTERRPLNETPRNTR